MPIPKLIHYCWYGNGPKPDCFEKCLASWKHYAPDYEIIEWNESNTDLHHNAFMEQAYAAKKYAFVSDVARLRIILEHGGVYMDTDVELKSPLDELIGHEAFFFFGHDNHIATGFGFGAAPGNRLVAKMLEDYDHAGFSQEQMKQLSCPILNTCSIQNAMPDFRAENRTQIIDGHVFLSSYDYKSFGLHYYAYSWMSAEDRDAMKYVKKRRRFFKLRRFLRSAKLFDFFHRHDLKKLDHLYRLLVYDILDMGVPYYIYKLYRKIKRQFFNR